MQIIDLGTCQCTELKGVGVRIAKLLEKCGILSIQDLLFHLPYRYQNRTHITPIINLRSGEYAVIEGQIQFIEVIVKRRAVLVLRLSDGSGTLSIRFFHFTSGQKNALSEGTKLRCFGEIREGFNGLEMVHPEYQRIFSDKPTPVEETLTPIYSTTQGLNQRSLRTLTDQALAILSQDALLAELIPKFVLEELNLPSINDAVHYVHRPPPDAPTDLLENGLHPAQQRLAFEELLAHQLTLRRLRFKIQGHQAPSLARIGALRDHFLKNLSFSLTHAQQSVASEISHDMSLSHPMLRLVQGDVGSGKTVVAGLAMLQAVENHYQAALMAPTELLGEQHYANFQHWFEPLNIKVVWLAGKHKGKARKTILQGVINGEVQIIIGTHALFQESVEFAKLGIIIIDEQHRFGVHQRLALREKGFDGDLYPHQLIMTATPIPRTLAMTAYADLDVSVIDELPPGRTPVETVAISANKRELVIQRVREACLQKRQAYWVCTLIDESEVLQCQAAEVTKQQLSEELPGLNIGIVHGRMKSVEKEAIMAEFKNKNIHLLVATTVIEVGVDVPNASLMIIENAERLGLSQLHQLRGRVGRGETTSYCVLLYKGPLSEMAKARLQIMRDTNDGFAIAHKDLELRGPGEVLGTHQTGVLRMRIADLKRDEKLLPIVKKTAELLLKEHPQHVEPVIQRWIVQGEEYGTV